jgi:hypothetical protein
MKKKKIYARISPGSKEKLAVRIGSVEKPELMRISEKVSSESHGYYMLDG